MPNPPARFAVPLSRSMRNVSLPGRGARCPKPGVRVGRSTLFEEGLTGADGNPEPGSQTVRRKAHDQFVRLAALDPRLPLGWFVLTCSLRFSAAVAGCLVRRVSVVLHQAVEKEDMSGVGLCFVTSVHLFVVCLCSGVYSWYVFVQGGGMPRLVLSLSLFL